MPKCGEITLWHGCYLVNLLHFFRTPFLQNTCGGLLLATVLGCRITYIKALRTAWNKNYIIEWVNL